MCNCSKRDRLILYQSPPFSLRSLSLWVLLTSVNLHCINPSTASSSFSLSPSLFTFICLSPPPHTSSWRSRIPWRIGDGAAANKKMWKAHFILFSTSSALSPFIPTSLSFHPDFVLSFLTSILELTGPAHTKAFIWNTLTLIQASGQ